MVHNLGRATGLWIAATASLTACAASTGILPAGPDTYTLRENYAPVRGGAATAERVALTEANRYCERQGKVFLPTNMRETSAPLQAMYGPTGYSLIFQCIPQDDPGLHRPRFESAPDVVIEQRDR